MEFAFASLPPVPILSFVKNGSDGARIISKLGFLADAVPAIRHHHERFDGHGYPDGIAGEEIPLGARIIFVADAYDAMTSERVYRRRVLPQEAIAELRRCAGTQFDPEIVDALADELAVAEEPRRRVAAIAS